MVSADLLLHPVRLRIVHAMYRDRALTTAELCERLPDVSTATMYRQVAQLVDGGMLEIDSEQKVRGVVERRYRLPMANATMSTEDVEAMTPDDHRRGMAAVVATILAEFDLYLDRDDVDVIADGVGYRQQSIWLNDEELAAIYGELRRVLSTVDGHPGEGKRRRLMTLISFPTDERPST
ncbi:helix-turn-helix protein [Herbihabitans rhizosphaerae]|uniref:Helix-turn-helix protein n=1 Tax=Herbihabitans rhizosphaerae TaxID=1872711 RepID=A0A4Q7L4Y5_9PSEU|nr:helix-turn-helix domain-containing protein [Herbihabitans rhizosphaerae]RZS44699.1 helix-turn-helix protein [Herbihabitans rhizosphaerae]